MRKHTYLSIYPPNDLSISVPAKARGEDEDVGLPGLSGLALWASWV